MNDFVTPMLEICLFEDIRRILLLLFLSRGPHVVVQDHRRWRSSNWFEQDVVAVSCRKRSLVFCFDLFTWNLQEYWLLLSNWHMFYCKPLLISKSKNESENLLPLGQLSGLRGSFRSLLPTLTRTAWCECARCRPTGCPTSTVLCFFWAWVSNWQPRV